MFVGRLKYAEPPWQPLPAVVMLFGVGENRRENGEEGGVGVCSSSWVCVCESCA